MSKVTAAARYARDLLPDKVVESDRFERFEMDVARLVGRPVPRRRQVLRTLDELDDRLDRLDVAAAESDDALRREFLTFRMDLDFPMPPDPYSSEYRRAVFELYELLHGSPYSTANEDTPFDTAAAVDAPFPFCTQSAKTVGDHLMGIGHIVRSLDLPPGSRVLEMGAGWGNTTLVLAQMGHKVTAIDVSPKFTDLIQSRAGRIGTHIDTVVGDFAKIHDLEGQFDAVVFFESFHHCSDHLGLLSGLDRVVAPGGQVMFAAEPIGKSFPVPWGLRLDGESLWAIRRHGWLELGFHSSYFVQTLDRYGWRVDRTELPGCQWGQIHLARRR
ncbi:MAG TPA: class I SAM-dependent methyltransferase [Acidimicrobiales bacterium]|nr:class I SAM-dependent methyltransferase [Acidimicrobiales bacterium]